MEGHRDPRPQEVEVGWPGEKTLLLRKGIKRREEAWKVARTGGRERGGRTGKEKEKS